MTSKLKLGGALAACCVILAFAAPALADGEDPLVSLSYLNKRLAQVESKISNAGSSPSEASLAVVNLDAGDRIIAAQGAELIPRSGRLTVLASALGGLSDITAGGDVSEGEAAKLNHLLIAPRSDGRGLEARGKAIVMVRGSYRVENN